MNSSNLSFAAKVIVFSAGIGAGIKYALPLLLVDVPAGQNNPALGVVVALLLAPSAIMGSLFWLRRSSNS
ncbi:hypothetical protein [Leptolyngbya sp. KIOST-1]|uniref:hypothetical protein n=1 Tax=Leptolyngbya sp. KIOST-1 TaxID=1229172 RepID=UPI0005681891|nr:hypothetical protein [Leptolyngbya sp. KIOST-1]